MSTPEIRPAEMGEAAYIAYLHGVYYKKNYNLGGTVEYYFMKTLTDFVRDNNGGMLWVADIGGKIAGSIGIVKIDDKTAQLRWFIVDTEYQNMGLGNGLMQTAMSFCEKSGYTHIFLWTFSELDAARRIYQKYGFRLTEQKPNNEWRQDEIMEQKWERAQPL